MEGYVPITLSRSHNSLKRSCQGHVYLRLNLTIDYFMGFVGNVDIDFYCIDICRASSCVRAFV